MTEHLADLGNPTWYARFAAQAMADPAYHKIVVKDALASPSLVQVIEGINRCLPDLPRTVHTERNVMARNLLMHTCAEWERALAADERSREEHEADERLREDLRPEGGPLPRSGWREATSSLIDAIVGLWLAPTTSHDGKIGR